MTIQIPPILTILFVLVCLVLYALSFRLSTSIILFYLDILWTAWAKSVMVAKANKDIGEWLAGLIIAFFMWLANVILALGFYFLATFQLLWDNALTSGSIAFFIASTIALLVQGPYTYLRSKYTCFEFTPLGWPVFYRVQKSYLRRAFEAENLFELLMDKLLSTK